MNGNDSSWGRGARKEYAASHHLFNTAETAFRIAVRIDDEQRSRKTVSIAPERYSPFPPEGIPPSPSTDQRTPLSIAVGNCEFRMGRGCSEYSVGYDAHNRNA